jgi:small subunit ribosomal protein S6
MGARSSPGKRAVVLEFALILASGPEQLYTPLPAMQDAHDQRGKPLATNQIKPYETVYIVRPNLDEDAVDRVVLAVEEYIKGLGGTIETTDKKGRRRLAYEVDKMRDGYYVLTIFHIKADVVSQIKRMMTLSEDIIRSLIVIHEKESAKTL